MKILLTTHQFFPEFGAGTEVLTRAVAREMTRRGHEVRVLTGFPSVPGTDADDARCERYTYEGLQVYRFRHAYEPMGGQVSMLEISFDNQLAAAFFSRIVAEFQPDVVHFFHFNRLGTGMVDAVVEAGVPAWFTPTDFWTVCATAQLRDSDGQVCPGPSAHAGNCALHFASHSAGGRAGRLVGRLPAQIGDLLVRSAAAGVLGRHRLVGELRAMGGRLDVNISRLNRLQGIVAPNRMMADFLMRHGVRRELLSVRPFGIEQDKVTSRRAARCARDQGALRLGFIGTLLEHKGCHVLLDALARVPPGTVETRIYGSPDDDPTYMARLRALAAPVGTAEFCGTFPSEAISDVLAQLDVLVVPSVWNENTPLVLYAAQAAGCPVIASDMPGLAEALRDGEDGLLFRAGDSDALAAVLARLAGDRQLLQRMMDATRRPQDIAGYCDELLGLWCAAVPLGAGCRGGEAGMA